MQSAEGFSYLCGRHFVFVQCLEHRYTVDIQRAESFYPCRVWNIDIHSIYSMWKASAVRAVYETLVYSPNAVWGRLFVSMQCVKNWYTVNVQRVEGFSYPCSVFNIGIQSIWQCGRLLLSVQCMEHWYIVDMQRVEGFPYQCSVWNIGIQSKFSERKASMQCF